MKTLRATPRSIMGEIKEPCDVVLGDPARRRLLPTEVIEMPVEVARQFVGKNGKVGWTQRLADDEQVRRISAGDLLGATHQARPPG